MPSIRKETRGTVRRETTVPKKGNRYIAQPRLTWLFLIVSAVGILLANSIWLFPSLRDINDSSSRLRIEIATRAASTTSESVVGNIRVIETAADLISFTNKEDEGALLNDFLKKFKHFNSISIIGADFKERLKLNRYSPEVFRDYSEYEDGELKLSLENGEIYVSPVTRSELLDPVLLIAAPITQDGAYGGGALVVTINLKLLLKNIELLSVKEKRWVFITSEDATLIAGFDAERVSSNVSMAENPAVQQTRTQEFTPAVQYVNEDGVRVVASGVIVQRLGWIAVVEQNFSEITVIRNRFLLLASLSFSIGILLLFLLFSNNLKSALLSKNLEDYVIRLNDARERLEDLLHKNSRTTRLLKQREETLTDTNRALKERNSEFNEVTKILVHRDLELSLSNERLRDLDMIKSEFVSVAAHQLRTPLAGIRWTIQSLLEESIGKLGSEQKKISQDALTSTTRLIALIGSLLDVARLEEGRFGFNLRLQPFLPMLEQMFSSHRLAAKEKGITLEMHFPKTNIPKLNFDDEKLAIVFDNLMSNAIKYTAPGGTVSLSVQKKKEEVIVSVRDSGIGIPKKEQKRIFEKFFRAENVRIAQTSGTGLGLYLARNIVLEHNGQLTFKSEEQKGSIFSVSLPIPREKKTKK